MTETERAPGGDGLRYAPRERAVEQPGSAARPEQTRRIKLGIVQTKPCKGDLDGNFAMLGDVFRQLAADPPDLIALPEAALTGYFLEGAVYDLAQEAGAFADRLARSWHERCARPVDMVCGFYENDEGAYYNSAVYLSVDGDGAARIAHVHRKMFLPTYGVFDEERFLSRGRRMRAFETRFGRMAILICEDAWHAIMPTVAAVKGARVLIVPSASPGRGLCGGGGELESVAHWRELLASYAVEHGVFIVYAGLAGFEGGKGMTGSSCVVDPFGRLMVAAPALGACLVRATIDLADIDVARAGLPLLGDLAAVLPDLLLDEDLPLPRGIG
jgi:N-carbamoylputrescine amidase